MVGGAEGLLVKDLGPLRDPERLCPQSGAP